MKTLITILPNKNQAEKLKWYLENYHKMKINIKELPNGECEIINSTNYSKQKLNKKTVTI